MSNPITPRDAFKLAWRKARQYKKVHPEIRAYMIAERAVDDSIYAGGYDYEPFLDINRAVIWAVHWRFEKVEMHLPKWTSERWLGFSMGPEGSSTWFDNPRLP